MSEGLLDSQKRDLASILHAAWGIYADLLGEAPHGTIQQMRALVELMRLDGFVHALRLGGRASGLDGDKGMSAPADVYDRALARLDGIQAHRITLTEADAMAPLLRALLVERCGDCPKCNGKGVVSVRYGTAFETDSAEERAELWHSEPCDCRRAADAAIATFAGGPDA